MLKRFILKKEGFTGKTAVLPGDCLMLRRDGIFKYSVILIRPGGSFLYVTDEENFPEDAMFTTNPVLFSGSKTFASFMLGFLARFISAFNGDLYFREKPEAVNDKTIKAMEFCCTQSQQTA